MLPLFVAGCGGQASHDLTGTSGDSGGLAGAAGAAIGASGAGATTAGNVSAAGATDESTGEGGGGGATTAGGGAADAERGTTLILDAWGGPSGEVATDVQSLEPHIGPQETCDRPLNGGACQLTTCKEGGIGTAAPGYGNFGRISASVGAATVQLTYDGFGYGTVRFPPSVTLGTGGIMTFHGGNAAGVPAFDVSATIPGLAVITSPVPAASGSAVIIDTSQDLSVTWLPIAIGQIHFYLDGGDSLPGGIAVTVRCTFEGTAGAGIVPQALLSSLRDVSATRPTYAGLSSDLVATSVVDGLTITTWSHQSGPTANRDFNVTLQ